MPCSPSYLYIDMTLWLTSGIYDTMVEAYQNRSSYLDKYDCALTTVGCDSQLVSAVASLDHTVYYWFDLIAVYIILTTVVVVGIVGNIVTIVIFSTHQIVSDSTNVLLLAVAASDLLNLLVNAWLLSNSFLCYLDVTKALTAFNISFATIITASRFVSLLSLDFVTVISMQRAIAVLFPFKSATIFSPRNTKIVIVSLVVLCFGSMMVNFIYDPLWLFHPYFNESISLALNYIVPLHIVISYCTYYLNSRSGINLVLLFLTGSFTVLKLRSHVKARAAMKSNPDSKTSDSKMSGREASMVKMSLTVCLFTVIFYTLSMTGNEILHIHMKELFTNSTPVVTNYCIFLCNSLCSSFNFFLYLMMSPKYRQIFGSWFRYKVKETTKE